MTGQGDDPPKADFRIGGERLAVGVGEVGPPRRAAGVGVLHDDASGRAPPSRRPREQVRQPPGGLRVEEVQVREREPRVLRCRVPERTLAHLAVAGALLVRVLAVAQDLGALEGDVEVKRQLLRPAKVVHDGGVVRGGMRERGARELAALLGRDAPAQCGEGGCVVLGSDHHHDVGVVLGCRTEHGRTTDVDLLQGFRLAHPRPGDGLPERIEVGHYDVDRDDAVRGELAHVRLLAAREDAAVDARVKGLHPAVKDLREAGDVADRHRRDAGLDERREGAAGADELEPQLREAASELLEATLVVDADERAPGRVSCLGAHTGSLPERARAAMNLGRPSQVV